MVLSVCRASEGLLVPGRRRVGPVHDPGRGVPHELEALCIQLPDVHDLHKYKENVVGQGLFEVSTRVAAS